MKYFIQFCLIIYINSFSIKDKYCGDDNCYTLLGISDNASADEIRQAFRSLSKIYHPDKAKIRGEDTNNKYRKIIQAYEVLINEETRGAYLDYLRNPNKNQAFHYYRYYQAQYNDYLPKTNPYLVLFIIMSALSTIHYTARYGMYKNAVKNAAETSHFKRLVNDKYQDQEGKHKKFTKDEIRDQMISNINIQGAYSKPQLKNIWFIALTLFLWDNLIFEPYFYFRWRIKYENKATEVQQSDANIKSRKILGIGKAAWNDLDQKQRDSYIERKLWIQQNFDQLKYEQAQQYQEYLDRNQNKIKQFKRWNRKQL